MHLTKTEAPYLTEPIDRSRGDLLDLFYHEPNLPLTDVSYNEAIEDLDRRIRRTTSEAEAAKLFRVMFYLKHRAYREHSTIV